MGTFHDDRGELHGITVVVDTSGPKVFIGRCDQELPEGILLLDADVHEEVEGGDSKAQFVERAAKFGHWKKLERVMVPQGEITSVRRLGEITAG